MYPPLFRFDQPGLHLLCELIRRKNGVALDPQEITVGYPVNCGRTRTLLPLTAQPGVGLKGSVEVTYERLDLNRFFFAIPFTFEVDGDLTEQWISQYLLQRWKVRLDPTDIELTIEQYEPHLPRRVTIRAREHSLVWVGEVEGWLLPVNPLRKVFHEYELSFNDGNVKRNAFLYSIEMQIEVADDHDLVAQLTEGHTITTLDCMSKKVVNALRQLTGDPWCVTLTATPFNLRGASVIYAGPAKEAIPTKRVIVVQLGQLCDNLFGNLLIHFHSSQLSENLIADLDGFSG